MNLYKYLHLKSSYRNTEKCESSKQSWYLSMQCLNSSFYRQGWVHGGDGWLQYDNFGVRQRAWFLGMQMQEGLHARKRKLATLRKCVLISIQKFSNIYFFVQECKFLLFVTGFCFNDLTEIWRDGYAYYTGLCSFVPVLLKKKI